MSCPTPEQLAAVAIGLADDPRVVEHAATCDACARVIAAQRDVLGQLSAVHKEIGDRHDTARAELLRSLPHALERHSPSSWRRWALGGIAAAAMLLLSFFALAPSRLSAMERIQQAVRHINSLSCKLTNTSELPPTDESPARTHRDERFIYWRAATDSDQFGDLHATTTINSTWHRPGGDEPPLRLVDLVEIHPSGKPGILVDYLARKFYRVPPLHAKDIQNSPPLLWLQAVRERAGKVVKDLGSREINGHRVHGILMTFDDRPEFKNYNPVEVWLDPQTDLPVEFRFQYSKGYEEGFTDRWVVTDIQWNHDLDPRRFDTTPPDGFLDITVPKDEKSIDEVVRALRLFAELSGGRYPLVQSTGDRNYTMKFDADACSQEMLQLAGLDQTLSDQRQDDPMFQQIEKSRAGLEILQRVLANPKWIVGYYGGEVLAPNADKLLMWWDIPAANDKDHVRLFYGDLRTEVVSDQEWARLVPPEIAELTQ